MQVGKDIHAAVQYFLNGDLAPELIRKQVRELAAGGYKCIYGHARQGLTTPYLSEHWWRAIDVIVEECDALGIKFAIWDEDYYPSPSAGNRVMWEAPELASQQLYFTVREFKAGKVRLALEQAQLLGCFAVTGKEIREITSFCGTVCDEWNYRSEIQSPYSWVMKVGAPHWRAGLGHRCWTLEWEAPADCTIVAVQIRRNFGPGANTDVLNAEAVRLFLRVTHEKYLERYGQEKFDRVFAGTFMDEPAPWGNFPWTGKYAEEFRKRFGQELLPLLPHLVLDIDENSRLHRLHYRDIQRELICRNYLGTMQEWCKAHNIPSIGHLSRTEHLSRSNYSWPDELRCCKYLDLPCTDPLGANMGWPDTASYHTGLKVVSSAAYWFDKPQAGSDALAVCGSETGLRELRYMADYQMVFGITYFNLHGAAVSWAGPRKDEVPPSLFYQHSQWPLMKHLWKHLDECCQRLAQGKEHVSLVVYYPAGQLVTPVNAGCDRVLEAHVHRLSEALMSRHKEFVFIDSVTMAEQEPAAFARRYPYLVIPEGVVFYEPEAEKFLAAYRAAGGKVTGPESLAELPGADLQGEGAEDVFLHRRELPDGMLDTFLFNRSERLFRGTLEGKPVEVPPRSGCFAAAPRPETGSVTGTFGPWSLRFGQNMVPLCRFQPREDLSRGTDLLMREVLTAPEDGICESRFLAQGEFRSLHLVTDAELCTVPYRVLLNGQEIGLEKRGRFYDEDNGFYNLLPALRTGSVPTQNVLQIVCPGGELREQSYLLGDFRTEFRHGGDALPYLTGAVPEQKLERFCDWRELGFGSYSGCGVYRTECTLPEPGSYRLSLGVVESAVEIFADGKVVGVLYSAPYELELPELSAGKHVLEFHVYNASGNRDRLSGRPAGLLGPVSVAKKEK